MANSSLPISLAQLEFTTKYKLPVKFDTAIELNLTNEKHTDEDDAFGKVSTLPDGILAVRVFGCIGLSSSDLKMEDNVLVYARVIAGAYGKNTKHKSFGKGKPTWNECLFFPAQLTGNPKSTSNHLTILIIWRDETQDIKSGLSNHKLLGKAEFCNYKLAKHTKSFETVDITNRKQQVVGQLQIEMALIYGPFGYGQSFQLQNHLYKPDEMVKVSFYPKVTPSIDGPQFRGNCVFPRKILHPSFIPFTGKATRLEPAISETYNTASTVCKMTSFPALVKSMTRAVKDHQAKQTVFREKQEQRKKEALDAVSEFSSSFVEALNSDVEAAYNNQRRLEAEAKQLQYNVSKLTKQSAQWISMIENFNESLKELGDVENWAKTIETDMMTIASALEYAYKGDGPQQ
eukprot:gene3283-3765_t